MLSEVNVTAVFVAAIEAQGSTNHIADIISETVDALIDADRKLNAYESESISEAR